MTLSPWPVAYPDSAVGANTIGDLVWRGLQLRSLEANPTTTQSVVSGVAAECGARSGQPSQQEGVLM